VAVASLKKYLADDRYRISLHDLVRQEAEKLYGELSDKNFPSTAPFIAGELRNRVQRYEALAEILQALMITGCYWGEKSHEDLWARCLERIANPSEEIINGVTIYLELRDLRLYPALLLLYSGGIASIAAERYGTFSTLLTKAKVRDRGKDHPVVLALYPEAVMEQKIGQQLPGMERRYTPLSDHLYEVLRELLREFLPEDICYEGCFDRFEYLLALVHADLRQKEGDKDVWGPPGRFSWKNRRLPQGGIMNEIELEARSADENWPPLKAGFFDSSLERFLLIKTAFDEFIAKRFSNLPVG